MFLAFVVYTVFGKTALARGALMATVQQAAEKKEDETTVSIDLKRFVTAREVFILRTAKTSTQSLPQTICNYITCSMICYDNIWLARHDLRQKQCVLLALSILIELSSGGDESSNAARRLRPSPSA